MSNNVYHLFTVNDKFETKVYASPSIVIESGSTGWSSNMGGPSGSLSLYGGVRARTDVSSGSASGSGLEVYPLDEVDTHSIDKIIQISGSYPATGSVLIAYCTNTEPVYVSDITDTRWYEEHYRPIAILSEWYHDRVRANYLTMAQLSASSSGNLWVVHIPKMFYGRQIATGTVAITDYSDASGTQLYYDDGYGSLRVSGTTGTVGNVFYSEGLIVFSNNPAVGPGKGPIAHSPKIRIAFSGSHIINSKIFMCRMNESECNCSRNPTWSTSDGSGTLTRKGADNTTYVTAVGIYNEDYELVAIAKLAQPIRKREKDRVSIRLRLDV